MSTDPRSTMALACYGFYLFALVFNVALFLLTGAGAGDDARYVLYAVSVLAAVVVASAIVMIHRHGAGADAAHFWTFTADCCLIGYLVGSYLVTHSYLNLATAAIILAGLFGPGSGRRRRRVARLIGEKSQALLSRLGRVPGNSTG